MDNIKQHLLNIGLVEDTEYLDKYVELILTNKKREYEIAKTQSHHIVPVFYYKELQIHIDNSEVNRVNLLYKDHLLHIIIYAAAVNCVINLKVWCLYL